MEFNAEIISFKLMNSTGTLRISLDVPEVQSPAVLQMISNYLKQPIIVNIDIDKSIKTDSGFNKISDAQNKYIHKLYRDIAVKYNKPEDEIKKALKNKIFGDENIQTTDLSYAQADDFIQRLKNILEGEKK